MKKNFFFTFLILLVALSCLIALTACNNQGDAKPFGLVEGSRPDYASLFSEQDLQLINSALGSGADEQTKKLAVMALYNTANKSRINTSLSLMLQNSDAGIDLGDVIMHGFNLKSGDKWYYQLATEVSTANEFLTVIMQEFAGLLKVAYAPSAGEYYYSLVKGAVSQCKCDVEYFPYANFVLTKEPELYSEQSFAEELHYLGSMHEICNLDFCAEIIADGATITFEDGVYTVEFAVDMEADEELITKWYAMAEADMAVSGNHIKKYNSYSATLKVWDNGYAKSFKSYSDRSAGLASGKPVDDFTYIWKESEILSLLHQDETIENGGYLHTVEDFIEYYSNPTLSAAKLSTIKIAAISVGSVLGALVLALIATCITVEVLIKNGKLPKLAAKREAMLDKKRAKRDAKRNGKKNAPIEEPLHEEPENIETNSTESEEPPQDNEANADSEEE